MFMRSDKGPEFVSRAILERISNTGITTLGNERRKPWQNGTDEHFNRQFRDKCLSLEWFRSRIDRPEVIGGYAWTPRRYAGVEGNLAWQHA